MIRFDRFLEGPSDKLFTSDWLDEHGIGLLNAFLNLQDGRCDAVLFSPDGPGVDFLTHEEMAALCNELSQAGSVPVACYRKPVPSVMKVSEPMRQGDLIDDEETKEASHAGTDRSEAW